MNTAARALDGHASSLGWAQGQAAEAIALWEQGEQATRQAMASGMPFGQPFGAQPLGAQPSTLGLTDPGAALRKQAIDVLERAREQLSKAGDTQASAIEQLAGKADGAPTWLTGPAQVVQTKGPQKVAVDIKQTESWLEKGERQQSEGSRFARYGQWGDEFDRRQGPGVNATVVGAKAEGSLFSSNAVGAHPVRRRHAGGQAEAKALGAEASANAGISRDGLNAQAKVECVPGAGGRGGLGALRAPPEVGGSAQGFVGPRPAPTARSASTGPGRRGRVRRGQGRRRGPRRPRRARCCATGEAWAGAGAEANATFGKNEDGGWTIGAEAGAGLGVGGKVGFEVTVDPGELKDYRRRRGRSAEPVLTGGWSHPWSPSYPCASTSRCRGDGRPRRRTRSARPESRSSRCTRARPTASPRTSRSPASSASRS